MTAPPEVTPSISQIPMGPPLFATIYDIRTVPSTTSFTVTFTTDQAIQCSVVWTAGTQPPAVGGAVPTGTVTDASAVTQHSLVISPAGAAPGFTYTFQIIQAATDSSGLVLRPRDGFVQLTGARAAAGKTVPVRFYRFGGTPPAPAGGGSGTGAGNWNQYTWAQWNAKGTTYPTP